MIMPYIVLSDAESQERADKRRHEMLRDQDKHIREVFRKRLGAIEERPLRDRRTFYAKHIPVFVAANTGLAIERVTVDEWLEAVTDEDVRAELIAHWGGLIPAIADAFPPEGAPVMGSLDPMTGQQMMISEGTPNYQLRLAIWTSAREILMTEGVTNDVRTLGWLLTGYWRERFFYDHKRLVKQIRDMRQVMRAPAGQRNGSAPEANGTAPSSNGAYA